LIIFSSNLFSCKRLPVLPVFYSNNIVQYRSSVPVSLSLAFSSKRAAECSSLHCSDVLMYDAALQADYRNLDLQEQRKDSVRRLSGVMVSTLAGVRIPAMPFLPVSNLAWTSCLLTLPVFVLVLEPSYYKTQHTREM